jgi:hypothetical protein
MLWNMISWESVEWFYGSCHDLVGSTIRHSSQCTWRVSYFRNIKLVSQLPFTFIQNTFLFPSNLWQVIPQDWAHQRSGHYSTWDVTKTDFCSLPTLALCTQTYALHFLVEFEIESSSAFVFLVLLWRRECFGPSVFLEVCPAHTHTRPRRDAPLNRATQKWASTKTFVVESLQRTHGTAFFQLAEGFDCGSLDPVFTQDATCLSRIVGTTRIDKYNINLFHSLTSSCVYLPSDKPTW